MQDNQVVGVEEDGSTEDWPAGTVVGVEEEGSTGDETADTDDDETGCGEGFAGVSPGRERLFRTVERFSKGIEARTPPTVPLCASC